MDHPSTPKLHRSSFRVPGWSAFAALLFACSALVAKGRVEPETGRAIRGTFSGPPALAIYAAGAAVALGALVLSKRGKPKGPGKSGAGRPAKNGRSQRRADAEEANRYRALFENANDLIQ